MIAAKSVSAERAQAQAVKRVGGWLEDLLPDEEKEEDDGGTAAPGKETSVIVNQLACKEAGCPDVELVITLIRAKPRPKLMFKVFKAAADLSKDDVEEALRTALADERAQEESAGSHEHGHADGHADGHNEAHEHGHGEAHGDNCGCEHDHGGPDKQSQEGHGHEHGHA